MNREIKKKIKAGFVRNNNLEWVSHLQTYCDNVIILIIKDNLQQDTNQLNYGNQVINKSEELNYLILI